MPTRGARRARPGLHPRAGWAAWGDRVSAPRTAESRPLCAAARPVPPLIWGLVSRRVGGAGGGRKPPEGFGESDITRRRRRQCRAPALPALGPRAHLPGERRGDTPTRCRPPARRSPRPAAAPLPAAPPRFLCTPVPGGGRPDPPGAPRPRFLSPPRGERGEGWGCGGERDLPSPPPFRCRCPPPRCVKPSARGAAFSADFPHNLGCSPPPFTWASGGLQPAEVSVNSHGSAPGGPPPVAAPLHPPLPLLLLFLHTPRSRPVLRNGRRRKRRRRWLWKKQQRFLGVPDAASSEVKPGLRTPPDPGLNSEQRRWLLKGRREVFLLPSPGGAPTSRAPPLHTPPSPPRSPPPPPPPSPVFPPSRSSPAAPRPPPRGSLSLGHRSLPGDTPGGAGSPAEGGTRGVTGQRAMCPPRRYRS